MSKPRNNMAGDNRLSVRHRRRGAVVLCGGESRRMGRDKASLEFDGETLLGRTVRILGDVVPRENTVIVAAKDQPLPALPPGVIVIRDEEQGRGPLPAVVAGLAQLAERAEAAFVSGCDAPLLKPAIVTWLLERLAAQPTADAAVPRDHQRFYPLSAAYRPSAAAALGKALASGVRSLQRALEYDEISTLRIDVDELRQLDPQLESLVNCNTSEDLATALRSCDA